MEKVIKNIFLEHKNKRIGIREIDDALRKNGINILIDPKRKTKFVQMLNEQIALGVLVPLKTAKPLQHYDGLPSKYTLHRDAIHGNSTKSTHIYLNELMTLSPVISIDYYATHPDQYVRDRDYIKNIDELLRTNDAEELTANERSYLIFGDEKAITAPVEAAVDGNAVLKNLKLELDDIKAKKVFEPFFFFENGFTIRKGSRRSILIIENKDTFWTLHDALRSGAIENIHLIIYGEGNAILKKFEYIRTLQGEPDDHYLYFGDIDREGIHIFNRFRDNYPDYDIRPAVSLYTYILHKAEPNAARPLRKARTLRSFSLSPFIDFFDPDAKKAINNIIRDGKYLPQEILNKTDIGRLKQIGIF